MRAALLLSLLLATPAVAAPPAPSAPAKPTAPSAPARPEKPAKPAAPAAPAALFDFHSGFWVNLHQRLWWESRAQINHRGDPSSQAPGWTAAIAFYAERYGKLGPMGLLFDDDLVAINRRLSELPPSGLGSGADAELPGIDPALAKELRAAAADFRPRWPEMDSQNLAWAKALEPLLARHGVALRDELARVYHHAWPGAPIRVDVATKAGPVGAYTVVLDPVHITVSSSDPSYQGQAGLEMIFHEASHGLIETIQTRLDAEAARQGKKQLPQLWHTILFYTTGEIVRRALGPDYVPYAKKNGLWENGWQEQLRVLETAWQPYLDGKIDLDTAIAAVITAMPAG